MSKVLLLNSNDEPLLITNWKRAVVLLLKGKAECIEKITRVEDFLSGGCVPKTIRLTYEMAIPDMELPFSRENIFHRDNYTCQYCGKQFPISELTLDHVYPKSRLGPDIWENIVTCCKHCNQYKADRTPKESGMKLLKCPYRPQNRKLFELEKQSKIEQFYWKKYYYKQAS